MLCIPGRSEKKSGGYSFFSRLFQSERETKSDGFFYFSVEFSFVFFVKQIEPLIINVCYLERPLYVRAILKRKLIFPILVGRTLFRLTRGHCELLTDNKKIINLEKVD